MATKKRRTNKRKKQQQEMLIILYAILLIVIALVGLLKTGVAGKWLVIVMQFLTGRFYPAVLVMMILVGLWMAFRRHLPEPDSKAIIGLVLILLAVLLYNAIPADKTIGAPAFKVFWNNSKALVRGKSVDTAGGLIGACLYFISSSLVDVKGTYLVIAAFVIVAVLLFVTKEHMEKLRNFITLPFHMPEVERKETKKKEVKKEQKAPAKKPLKELFIEKFEKDDDEEEYDEYPTGDTEFITLPEGNKKKKKPVFVDLGANDKQQSTTADTFAEEYVAPISHTPDVTMDISEPLPGDFVATPTVAEPVEEQKKDATTENVSDHYVDYKNYKIPNPPTRYLENVKVVADKQNYIVARQKADELIEVLQSFNINASLDKKTDIFVGPAVTKFVVHPDSGVKVSRIQNIQDNIKMSLAAKDIRIQAPIPGMNGVGVEIPNQTITPVHMREMFEAIPENKKDKKLLVILGKDLMGKPIFGELDRMPHMLVAGATGSGKSVCINAMICSLLLRTSPADLKILLIDPKQVEFPQYKDVPHLLGPIITDPSKAAFALSVIVTRMDERYKEFARVQVRKIDDYNKYVDNHPEDVKAKHMPYIVVFIDELADLMQVAGKEVEGSIQRITQLARAAGIHLVVATQRPSVNVITGVIKSNIPSRIAFAVSSQIDSRTILDHAGAEHLLGKGDMLYVPMGEPEPIRVQGAYVTDAEIEKITAYVASQAKAYFDDAFVLVDGPVDNSGVRNQTADPMYDEVKRWVIEQQKASTSLLQRAFGFGYNRAAKIVDMLQQDGIVGPAQGSKPREVLIKPDQLD